MKMKYGLDSMGIALRSNDYGWLPKRETGDKTHLLINRKDIPENFDIMSLASAWRDTGHFEWEYLLGVWFLWGVIEAEEKNEEYADISKVFETDLLASRDRTFTREKVREHIGKWFEKISEDDETVYWRLKIKNREEAS